MAYFKITMPKADEMLPMYTSAPNKVQAQKRVERLFGPLKNAKIAEVTKAEIPEGENLL